MLRSVVSSEFAHFRAFCAVCIYARAPADKSSKGKTAHNAIIAMIYGRHLHNSGANRCGRRYMQANESR
jgi:hypothetical protein